MFFYFISFEAYNLHSRLCGLLKPTKVYNMVFFPLILQYIYIIGKDTSDVCTSSKNHLYIK